MVQHNKEVQERIYVFEISFVHLLRRIAQYNGTDLLSNIYRSQARNFLHHSIRVQVKSTHMLTLRRFSTPPAWRGFCYNLGVALTKSRRNLETDLKLMSPPKFDDLPMERGVC